MAEIRVDTKQQNDYAKVFESYKKGKSYFLHTLEEDFSDSIKKGLHRVEFKNKKLINLEFLQQYAHVRSKTTLDFLNTLEA